MKLVFKEKINGYFITASVVEDKLYYDVAKESTGRKLLSGVLEAKTTKVSRLKSQLINYVNDVDSRNVNFKINEEDLIK